MKQLPSFRLGVNDWGKKLASAMALMLFLSAGVFTAHAMPGNTPVFNGIVNNCGTKCDYPTVQVGKPGATWDTKINANVNDYLTIWVWDHNNAVDLPSDPSNADSIARNVHIKAALSPEQGMTHSVNATVSADNAAPVYGAVQINVPQSSKITFVPGSAKVYRNINQQLSPVAWDTNPDAIVTDPNGLNMHDQKGCWAYSQAVLFQVHVEGLSTGTPQIFTEKRVQVGGTSTDYVKSVQANPGDIVDFRIQLQNTGTATGVNPVIKDTLDSHFTALGTTDADQANWPYIVYKVNNADVTSRIDPAHFTHNGQYLSFGFGDMQPGPQNALFLVFFAKVNGPDQFSVGSNPLQNCETASFTGVSASDCVNINIVKSATPVVNFTLVKYVKNLTLNENEWHTTAAAKPGDKLAYRLALVNTGNTSASNVSLKDNLPAQVTYANQATLTNASVTNQNIDATGLFNGGGYNFSTVGNGNDNDQIIIYTATAGGNCTTGMVNNNAAVYYNNQQVAQAQASVTISCSQGLIISKTIQDPNSKQFVHSISQVHEGDNIWYQIVVTNSGNVQLHNIILKDILPQQVSFVPGSETIDGAPEGSNEALLFDQSQGMHLTDLNPGIPKTFRFEVTVNPCPPLGDIPLVNTATVQADNVSAVSDSASTMVSVRKPTLSL